MTDALSALAAEARRALAGELPAVPAPDEPLRFLGSAADDRVRVEVDLRGRIVHLGLDPALYRLPLEDVAAAVRDAVNAALDTRPGAPDLSPLAAEVRAAQVQAREQLRAIGQRMAEVQQHLAEARGERR